MVSNAETSSDGYSATLPLCVSTIMGDIDVKEGSTILKRCQICACEPQVALDDCFRITKKEKFSPYLTVENLGFGDAAVCKTLARGENLSFELDENVSFRIFGNASIETEVYQYNPSSSFLTIKSIIRIGVFAYNECKMYLSFRNGDSYNLKPGECIIPRLGSSEDRAILNCKKDEWYDPDWDDWE